ncbi:hypothetical protein RI103_15990 [Paraburkholderia sp. FT54]|uniref:hypothetical protein n=1 Tax=Paraburkholderia sp. FT54 TaxID=3074437 RepID=UPI00287773D0|nr:hypothetical protein [Paraburkholderia sp. FT54]WNC89170.1 hypothetical protein RI103_15990 [Paraburkholderia sp. FT54]
MTSALKQMQSALLPAVAQEKNALAEVFVRFVLAGLDAIALAYPRFVRISMVLNGSPSIQ